MSGKSLVYTVDVMTAGLGGAVRDVLPDLAKKSHRFAASMICPKCGDYKSSGAKRCQTCYRHDTSLARAMHKPGAILPIAELSHKWRHGSVGTTPPQPTRPRMVKQPDGTWRATA